MKRRNLIVAAGLAAALLGTAACGSSSDSADKSAASEPKSITVWLQTDAQTGWPTAVEMANKAFAQKHPDTKVNVQYQQWSDHLTKLDAALAGSTPPDVVELGNTEMTKYMAAGAFADITAKKDQFDNSANWLQSLADSSTYEGKLYGVPYYAGARAVIYRTDMFQQAGVTVPKTRDELEAAAAKLNATFGKDKNFSAFYLPGKNWYAAMAFVYDGGGEIAAQDGDSWKGSLDSSQAQGALSWLKDFTAKYSKADKTGDEAKQDQAFAQGHIAMMIANGWEWGSILDAKNGGNPALASKLGAFPLPSGNGKDFAPSFLGGSDLAVTAKSKAADAAADWIAAYTSNGVMTELATKGKVIPNATTLTNINASDPQLAPFAAAATQSWFVPTSPNWATVESQNVMQDMLVNIYTGKQSVADATKTASEAITQTLGS